MKKISFRVEPFAPTGLFLLFFSWESAARAAVIASVLAHELAHLAAAKMCGGKVLNYALISRAQSATSVFLFILTTQAY